MNETLPKNLESWLPALRAAAGLRAGDPLVLIQEKMDKLANRAAPVSRSWWNWMMTIQGLSVAAPLLWLVRRPFGVLSSTAALVTLASVLILVAALWWMRWRGLQRTWARARLVAEVARSQIGTAACPVLPPRRCLLAVPDLQPLLLEGSSSSLVEERPKWKQSWLDGRLQKQLDYYRKAKVVAEGKRRALTRSTTLLMDVMLAMAVAGVLVTLSHRAPHWLQRMEDQGIECTLGVAGVLLPLGIILLHSLRHLQELNRRTARFARQITLLESSGEQLKAADTTEGALRIIDETEELLLSEVLDWYFEAETAEDFFQIRDHEAKAGKKHERPMTNVRWLRLLHWTWILGGAGLFFLCRVVLGRAPWVLLASALTLAWLSFTSPNDPEARSGLHAEAALVDDAGKPWNPDRERARHGCVIIAHGLHDGAVYTAGREESLWMREMSRALQGRLGGDAPNIGLVDWAANASPTNVYHIDPKITVAKFLGDLAGIPSEAREVGDYLGFRLAQLILEKKIDAGQPLHLIGHSAGGFVVARAALWLKQMNLAPSLMQVTILDTPLPDDELQKKVPALCPVDFYVTSGFVTGLDDKSPPRGMYLRHVKPDPKATLLEAHSFAHEWFTRTIQSAKPGESGFGMSLFLSKKREQ